MVEWSIVATSKALSIVFGSFGSSDGIPLDRVNIPSLLKNSLSILPR